MARMRIGLSQQTEQRMALSPSFLQALEVLQMGAAELVAEIEGECARNETLRLVHRGPVAHGDSDRRHEFLAQVESRPQDLLAHVREEVGLLSLGHDLASRVLALAELLDERGYLPEERVILTRQLGDQGLGDEGLDDALAVLRSIPPRGLGATGPIEAMLLQVPARDPDRPAIEAILRAGLEDLALGRREAVARRCALDPADLEALLQRIRRLDPRPASRFLTDAPSPRLPDLVVRQDGAQVVVELADGSLPALAVDDRIAGLASDRAAPRESRRRVAAHLRRARQLIRAVRHRGETLLQVARAVFAAQRDFFRRGPSAILHLRMRDLAAELGVHSSTISRAVASKTVWTDFGLLPLREFFELGGSGPTRAERDELVLAVRACLTADERMSDAVIAERLAERGLVVARRTVAKYRALLGVSRRARAERNADSGS